MKGEQHGHGVCRDWKEDVFMKYPCFPLGRLAETTTYLNLDIWQADRYSVLPIQNVNFTATITCFVKYHLFFRCVYCSTNLYSPDRLTISFVTLTYHTTLCHIPQHRNIKYYKKGGACSVHFWSRIFVENFQVTGDGRTGRKCQNGS